VLGAGPEPIEVSSRDIVLASRKLEGASTGNPAAGDTSPKTIPKVDDTFFYRGEDRLSRDGVLYMPCEEFLRALRPNGFPD